MTLKFSAVLEDAEAAAHMFMQKFHHAK